MISNNTYWQSYKDKHPSTAKYGAVNVLTDAQKKAELLIDFASRLVIKKPLPIVEWCEQNIYISPRQGSAFSGYYSTARTPYIRDVLASMDDPEVQRIVLAFGAQTGKSQAMIAFFCRMLACSPASFLVIQPASDECINFGETRLKPSLEDSPSLNYLIPADKRKNYQTANYKLAGSLVDLAGAGSPSKLASKPKCYVIADECDKFPSEFKREGDPIDLIAQRQKTFGKRAKMLIASTPTTPEGTIWNELQNGDFRRFHVPCLKCGEYSLLSFDNVKFNAEKDTPKAIANTAKYECPICHAQHDSKDKDAMVQMGKWVATKEPQISGCVSYHLQSIAAPWVSLESIVEKFITAKRGGKQKLRSFVNSELAEPWHESNDHMEPTELSACEADYKEGESFPLSNGDAPVNRVRYAGVDVQKSELVVVVREYSLNDGSSGLVYKTKIQGSDDQQWQTLDEICKKYDVANAYVDCQYRTNQVYSACAIYKWFVPASGSKAFRDGSLFELRTVNISRQKINGLYGNQNEQITAVNYDQSAVFDFCANSIKHEDNYPSWWIYNGASHDLQYVNEVVAKRKIGGRWGAGDKTDDHYGDAEKLAELGFVVSGGRSATTQIEVAKETEKDAEKKTI